MALTVAIQMDPIERIDIGGDSTFALALEAQTRGHGLLYYGPRDLTYREGKVTARVRPLHVRAVKGDHFALDDGFVYDLSAADVVLMRQDPPFDMAYISATHLLERIHPKTLVVNDPAEVRNAPEKLFVTLFADFIPPTLITSDPREIREFRDQYKDIILKPLYGNGGANGLFARRQGGFLWPPAHMHVGTRFAQCRNPVDGARHFAVHQDDALVALADFGNVALHDHRLAIESREHFQQRTQILVILLDAEDASAAIAVKRL